MSSCAFADDDCRPDFIALLCLRGDSQAATTLSPVEAMVPLLPPGAAAILAEPRYATTVDSAFMADAGQGGPLWISPIRVLSSGSARPRIRADFAETAGTDPAARDALAALRRAADTVASEIRLRSGDLLITENRHATHGRGAFLPVRPRGAVAPALRDRPRPRQVVGAPPPERPRRPHRLCRTGVARAAPAGG